MSKLFLFLLVKAFNCWRFFIVKTWIWTLANRIGRKGEKS